ncbi:MAG: transcription antitermination factor NusB [Candidatus Limnocylindrales bacterium]
MRPTADDRAARPARRGQPAGLRHAAARQGRELALAAVFEGDFGQRTAAAVLERRLADEAAPPETEALARELVAIVTRERAVLDERLAGAAPAYPIVSLARIDRALLRCGLSEVLHCPATPTRVAIAEWVELARTYSGEPARRLVNGVLGRIASEQAAPDTRVTRDARDQPHTSARSGEA